jgi:hypothetical protein
VLENTGPSGLEVLNGRQIERPNKVNWSHGLIAARLNFNSDFWAAMSAEIHLAASLTPSANCLFMNIPRVEARLKPWLS